MISFLDKDFSQLTLFLEVKKPSKLFFLVDENTHDYCLPTLLSNLETEIPFEIIEIEPGETLKNIETAAQLWEILAEFEADRKAILINLGGGVITDLGGFVASTYKRGIDFINIPTTLLAMCDASIGGKTGVDLNFFKNIVGTFSYSLEIFLYPDFLKTLPYKELRSGFAEMLKHGLIADKQHWEDLISLKELTAETIAPYLEKSMQIKQKIVEKDFFEKNSRKTLNFGHTIGHAIESLFLKSGNPIPHGEAVVLGMIVETHLSFAENFISENDLEHIVTHINRFFPKIQLKQFSNEEIFAIMMNDKKNENTKISFSLLQNLGSCSYNNDSNEEKIFQSIDYYRNLNS